MNDLQKALSLIEAQQKKAGAGTPAWCVGQQLADILNGQPAAAKIVAEDLGTTGMGIVDCEKKIAEFASKNRTGNVGFCGPADADRIIREFYGIPKLEIVTAKTQAAPAEHRRKAIRLEDFYKGAQYGHTGSIAENAGNGPGNAVGVAEAQRESTPARTNSIQNHKAGRPPNGHTGKICSLQLHSLRGIVAYNNSIAG